MGLKLMICVAFIAFVTVDAGNVPVCQQPLDDGPCQASVQRYFYNSTSDRCERFIYGGCWGNDNNFETCVECSVKCSKTADPWCPRVPLPIDACNEPKKVGPCRAAYRRFFYNKASGRCEKFIWGGCAPNANNFETCEECNARCSNDISLPCLPLQVPIVTPAPPVEVCDQPKKVGPCRAAVPRYYYNKASGRCEKFTWGGCAPNANNFETCGECSVTCAKDISLPCLPEVPNPRPPLPPLEVCDQPKKVGPCKAAVPRYYYNKASGRCEKFTWGGCAPNANNFETCGECSVTCAKDISLPCLPEKPTVNPSPPVPPVDVCEQPKYVGNCAAAFPQFYYNSATGRCEQFIYGGCGANDNNFDTCLECNIRCSRDVSQPCLPLPGVPTTPAPSRDVCLLPKDPGPCFGAFDQYYYNSASGRCERFIYGGCDGNGNNFDTCLECNSRCSNDIAKPCKEEPEFPVDPVDACDQPKEPGPCKLGLQRFYYNSVSGRCEVFVYGGCQANYNNFGTCLECSERCVKDNILQCLPEPPIVNPTPPVPPVDVCEQPKYVGNCAAAFPQFYYNSATGRCEQFIYGGCGANDNNFDTCLECNTRCSRDVSQPCLPLPGVPPTPAPSRDVCELPKERGPCRAAIDRYFYNSASGRCEKFIYGGCAGNGNNFATCVECNSRCSNDIINPCKEEPEFPFSPVDACDQPKEPGPCKLGLKRFYYNSVSGKCEEFIYGGCQANYNNFGTCLECSERCENKMVPA